MEVTFFLARVKAKAKANFLVMISEIEASAASLHNNSPDASIWTHNNSPDASIWTHNRKIGHSLICSGKAHFITGGGSGSVLYTVIFYDYLLLYCIECLRWKPGALVSLRKVIYMEMGIYKTFFLSPTLHPLHPAIRICAWKIASLRRFKF